MVKKGPGEAKGTGKERDGKGEANLKRLKELIRADRGLQKKLGGLRTGEAIYEALSKLGAEKGLTFTRRDFEQLVAHPERETAELTADEIRSMAGGFHIYPPKTANIDFGNTLIQTLRWFDIPLQR